MWAANAATAPAVNMSRIPHALISFNPAHMNYVAASDTCIQCHSQGQPLSSPIEGKYYDWPVGYHVGLKLADYWKLEDHTLGEPQNFLYFPDGTAHKNRMQGNDFVQSVMYRRGVTCFDCHDVHGTVGETRSAISASLGESDAFDRSITDFAKRYADQNERDYEAFTQAIRTGRLASRSRACDAQEVRTRRA